jgi:copper chaperone CopZ
MKIKVESEKIIKAVKKLDGIEIVLKNSDDAKEAVNLILRKMDLFKGDDYEKLKGVNVSSFQEYKTSAVDYKMIVLLEFLFEDNISLDTKVAVIKELQEFFGKV